MDAITKNKLDGKFVRLCDNLELEPGISLKSLTTKLESYTGLPILYEPHSLPDALLGFSFLAEAESYYIFYDKHRTGRSLNLTIAHELAHIIRGDFAKPKAVKKADVISSLNSGTHQIPGILCSARYGIVQTDEQQVEYLARHFLRLLASSPEDNSFQKWTKHWLLS